MMVKERQAVRHAREMGARYGRSPDSGGASVQIEFVSANPTGPLSAVHGRGAAVGDALGNLLEWSGFRVTREFYVNDAGSQLERFAGALEPYYLAAVQAPGAAPPDESLQDEFLAGIAAEIASEAGGRFAELSPDRRLEALARHGREAAVRRHRETLERFGVRFEEWYSERTLHETGRFQEVIELLRSRGHAYEHEGALWLRSTSLGDEQDHPLLRSNGRPTYIAGDLAYHLDKFSRGFDRIIDIWGPEHEAYVRRTKAGVRALGCDPDALEILILGPVSLKLDGLTVEVSAASGNNTGLEEVLQQVGGDHARFLYLSQPAGDPLELDLDLSRKQPHDNPAALVLSASREAREIVEQARTEGRLPGLDADLSALTDPSEQELATKLAEFPDALRTAAGEREPHRLTRFAVETAAAFGAVRARMGEDSRAWTDSHLAVAEATAVVMGNLLTVLGLPASA
jgi:arginyl-tRNA synthetase